jgi:hypothetical protein
MTSKSFVGRIEPDGRFVAHMVTYDGYPTGVGAALAEVLASGWAQGRPSRVLADMVPFRHWWSIGLDLEGPTRVGRPNQRPDEQDIPMVTGRLGRALDDRADQEWGYLFRGEEELLVVKKGPWWHTPAYAVQQWAVLDVGSTDQVDWTRLTWTTP